MELRQLFLLVLLFCLLGWVFKSAQLSSQTDTAMMVAEQQVLSEQSALLKKKSPNQTVPQLSQQQKTKPLHAVLAAKKLGIKESPPRSNRGDSIDAWWNHVAVKIQGIKLSDRYKYWCGVYVGEMLWQGNSVTLVLSASSFAYKVKGRAYTLADVMYSRYTPKSGDLRLKLRDGGGHVDIVYAWDVDDKTGLLIGGNVSDMVKARPCTIQSLLADRTTYFIDIEGYYGY